MIGASATFLLGLAAPKLPDDGPDVEPFTAIPSVTRGLWTFSRRFRGNGDPVRLGRISREVMRRAASTA